MKRLIVAIVAILPGLSAHADLPYGPTDAEFLSLPPFCKARMKPDSAAEKVSFEAQLGPNNFLHIHHYCIAANYANRLRFVFDRQKRGAMIGEAIDNYKYVLRAAERTFWMLPQIYLETGNMYLQSGQKGEAAQHFSQAIALNPSYEPAYISLVETYRQLGSTSAGLEVATAGLRHFPESKSLQKAYLSMGGRKPFPEPLPKERHDEKPEVESADAPKRDDDAGVPITGKGVANAESPAAPSSVPTADDDIPNGGCRFCPPDEIQTRWRESFEP